MQRAIEIAPYGNLLVYKKDYTPEFVKEVIEERRLDGLRIFDHLEPLSSLAFLRDYGFLEKLDIDSIHDHNYGFLRCLKNLRSLGIGISTKEENEIDLSDLENLEVLALQWRKNKI